jgi:hypothetical protein
MHQDYQHRSIAQKPEVNPGGQAILLNLSENYLISAF